MQNTTPSEQLIRDGITALREGNKQQALRLLYQATEADPMNQIAWLWLVDIVTTDDDRRHCFERIIAIDPNNRYGQQAAAALAQLSSPSTPPNALKQTPQSIPPDTQPSSSPISPPPPASTESRPAPDHLPSTSSLASSSETHAPSPPRFLTTLLGVITILLLALVISNVALVMMVGMEQARVRARQERLDHITATLAQQNDMVLGIMDSYEQSAYNNPNVDRIAEQQLIAAEHTLMTLQIIATQNKMMIEILASGP